MKWVTISPRLFRKRQFHQSWKTNNIIAKAKTGTGKTGAYAIPAINMVDKEDPNVQVLI
jgi:superfamily II DNA/RNA helicase